MSGRRRACALVLLAVLAFQPVAAARVAWADEGAPGGGGSSSRIEQVNKALGLLFMLFKLAEFLGTVELPPQGGPPDPQWGSHPGPLPSVTPPSEQPQAVGPPVREPLP